MIVIVLATVLILAIAFYQVLQGLFSALIMTVLTVLCAAIAIGYYENFAQLLYTTQPAYADAGAMMALLVLPLLALRIVFDKFLPRNVVMGPWSNRIGGGILGLITGTVLVGTLLLIAQMLPMGTSVLGYRPYDATLRRDQHVPPFYPDEFVVRLGRMLSAGSLSGEQRLSDSHDDLLLEAFCARNTAGKNGRVDAMPDSLGAATFREVQAAQAPWVKDLPLSPLIDNEMSLKQKYLIVEVRIAQSACEAEGSAARGWWFLPATHFRLTTQKNLSHYPVAYLTDANGHYAPNKAAVRDGRTEIANLIVQVKPAQGVTEADVLWVYRLPSDEDPVYMIFRRVSRKVLERNDRLPLVPPSAAQLPPTRPTATPATLSATRPATTSPPPVTSGPAATRPK